MAQSWSVLWFREGSWQNLLWSLEMRTRVSSVFVHADVVLLCHVCCRCSNKNAESNFNDRVNYRGDDRRHAILLGVFHGSMRRSGVVAV